MKIQIEHEVLEKPLPAEREFASLPKTKPITVRGLFAGALVAGGLVCITYFTTLFSVASEGSPTVNLDLLQQRQNGIIIGCAVLICGVVLAATGGHRRE